MIVLNLICSAGHRFEGWFASSDAFQDQMAATLVNCPHCGDVHLQRLPAVPHLAKSSRTPAADESLPNGEALLATLRSIVADSENVGNRFPEEARRMHYRETPARNIRGLATADETLELLDEGIDILPLPLPPKGETH